jgi:polyferredoxin
VTIPYTGNYNCVTMGYCYTGSILQAFQKVGVFKLKVRDQQVCRDCTTLDCAKSCPVGLVDMPGHFRQKGEFRSTKCCGVGNCVGACPYNNLYIYDIRHAVAERFGLRAPAPPLARLPMAGARGAPTGGSVQAARAPETSPPN